MPMHRTPDRYSQLAIFLHWMVFLLVTLAYLAIEFRGPKGSESRIFWTHVHFWAGTLVLAVAVVRLMWRLWASTPAELPGNRLRAFLARISHLALYMFIFLQPLLGILMVNTSGHPVTLAGLNLNLTLVGADAIAQPLIKSAHVWIGNAFYWVIGAHALAAIGHHVIFNDRTLRRMI
jgi:cytochrome b561